MDEINNPHDGRFHQWQKLLFGLGRMRKRPVEQQITEHNEEVRRRLPVRHLQQQAGQPRGAVRHLILEINGTDHRQQADAGRRPARGFEQGFCPSSIVRQALIGIQEWPLTLQVLH
ncbi:hypothetical protein [Halochromatium roseum]|uniref:hypothetical protein n=1 Tax=Halochromatium roseum TaxID=391920 RepID=UPI0019134BFA|nr:hypothetical protein [Halochromatium roseum]